MSDGYVKKSKKLFEKVSGTIANANKMVNDYNRLGKIPAMPAHAFLNLANSMYMHGCFKEAESLLQSVTEFPTKSSDALINLGIIKQSGGNFEEAIKYYIDAYKKDNNNVKALNLWGNCLTMMNRYDEALQKFKQANQIDETNSDVYLSWGALLIKKEQYKEAKEKLVCASEYNPADIRPVYMCAVIDIETENLDSALTNLEFVINSTENHFDAVHNLAYVYFKKQNYDMAIKYAKKALGMYMFKIETYIMLGDIYAIKDDEAQSMNFYEMAEKNNLKNFYLYLSWGSSLQKFEKHEEAIEKLKIANSYLNENHSYEVFSRMALSYLKTDNLTIAEEINNKALEICSDGYTSNSIAAEIEIKKGNYETAINYLNKCEDDYINKSYNYTLFAICYKNMNDNDSARKYFEKAIEYDNDETVLTKYTKFLNDISDFEMTKKKLKTIAETSKNTELLEQYFIALYNLAKQNGYKYNIESAIQIAEKIEQTDNSPSEYSGKISELKDLLNKHD